MTRILRLNQPLLPQCNFNGIPNAWAGLVSRTQLPGRARNYQQVSYERRALRTILEMSALFEFAAVFLFYQALS